MVIQILQKTLYFLSLNLRPELIWAITPLIIATLVMIIYSEVYKGETPGWHSHVLNSLVLLFVSMNLLRYIYGINNGGGTNFINYPGKLIVALFLLFLGAIIFVLNFQHFLPKKVAEQLNSPLTSNLLAYVLILFVYAETPYEWSVLLPLIIIFTLLFTLLNLVRIPMAKMVVFIQKLKKREEVDNIIEEKKKLEREKEDFISQKKKFQNIVCNIDKKKKEITKLKKIAKKRLKK